MFEEIAELLESRFAEAIDEKISILNYDNINKDEIKIPNTIRFTDIGGTQYLVSGTAGNGLYRFKGTLIIEVYTKSGTGTRINQQICDIIMVLFRKYQIGNLKTWVIGKNRVGEAKSASGSGSGINLYQQNVMITYQYDECIAEHQ